MSIHVGNTKLTPRDPFRITCFRLITECNQRLFLLSQLRHQGLPVEALDVIFQALILSKVAYALQAFAGHISVADRNKLDKFFRKSHRRGLVNQVFNVVSLINRFDLITLPFNSTPRSLLALGYLLPEKRH